VHTPRLHGGLAAFLAIGVLIFPYALYARVGETQEALEKRILQPGLGKLYPRVPDAAKDKEKPKKKDEDPLKDVRALMPVDTREMVYWKSAVANQLSNETGWKIDVLFVGGRSVLEAYHRVGDSLSEFEVRGILGLNKGNSSWKKSGNDGGGVNGIGYDYELEDGSLRAKQQDSWFIVFSTKLDNYVMQQQVVAKEAKDAMKEQQRRDQALKAPESISGL
jgi:hypothetical protein